MLRATPTSTLRPRRWMSSAGEKDGPKQGPGYQSAAQSVLDSLFAQSSSDRTKPSSPTSRASKSGSAPDRDDLLGDLESLIVERRINESLVLYRKIRQAQITIPPALADHLVRLCESMAHRFEYAVKLHELKAQLGHAPSPPSSDAPPSDAPLEAFERLLAQSHQRFLQLAADDPLQALAMFGELYDIQPKVDAQSFQSMVGNLSPLYLTKLKYAIRAKKPSSPPDLTSRTKENSRAASAGASPPRRAPDDPLPVSPVLPAGGKPKKAFFAPATLNAEVAKILEGPETMKGWDLLVQRLDDQTVLHESLRYFTAARQVWEVSNEAPPPSPPPLATEEDSQAKSTAIAASHLRQLEKEEHTQRMAKKKRYHAKKRTMKASSDHGSSHGTRTKSGSPGKLKSVTRRVKSRRKK